MAVIKLDHKCSLSAFSAISSLPESNLHHFDYELRHPLGIYRNSIREISQLFHSSLSALSVLQEEYIVHKTTNSYASVIDIYKNLLYRLREFIDDCYLIMQSIAPVDDNLYPKIIFSNQYLKKVKYPGFKSFEGIISYYKNEHVGAIVNSIKHKHRKIRGIYFYSKNEHKLFIPGYYIEGASKKGMLAPCRSVHSDENSAFSFNRDLKLHVWNLYLIDSALNAAINAAKNAWCLGKNDTNVSNESYDLVRIIEKVSKMPHQFYDDEQSRPTVRMERVENGYELEYPYKKGIEALPNQMRITSLQTVDMTVPSMKLPYFKQ